MGEFKKSADEGAIVPTKNLISLIGRVNPAELEQLRTDFPTQESILSPWEFGKTKEKTSASLDPDQRGAVRRALGTGVSAAISRLDATMQFILARRRTVSRVRLLGAILALLAGGGSFFSNLPGLSVDGVRLTLAALSLTSGVIGILAGFFETTPSGTSVSSPKDFAALIQVRVDIEKIQQRLSRDGVLPISDVELLELLEETDSISRQIIQISYK